MSPIGWAAFLLAAAAGAPARYVLDGIVQQRSAGTFPWGTLLVNVSGCFLLGVLTGWGTYHGLGPTARSALGTGGLGAYTTFSTFTFETVRLAEQGELGAALRNVTGNVLGGLTAAAAGIGLAAWL